MYQSIKITDASLIRWGPLPMHHWYGYLLMHRNIIEFDASLIRWAPLPMHHWYSGLRYRCIIDTVGPDTDASMMHQALIWCYWYISKNFDEGPYSSPLIPDLLWCDLACYEVPFLPRKKSPLLTGRASSVWTNTVRDQHGNKHQLELQSQNHKICL